MRLLVALIVSLSLVGCTPPPKAPLHQQRASATYSAPKDKVWPLLVSEVGLNYPIQAIEKESGLISTQFVNLPAGLFNMDQTRYIFPPGGFLATYNGLRMSMRILAIETAPDTTMVTIRAHYEAFEDNVSKSWKVARSNGAVENRILTNIEQQIR